LGRSMFCQALTADNGFVIVSVPNRKPGRQ
jgi:hypothetical protein